MRNIGFIAFFFLSGIFLFACNDALVHKESQHPKTGIWQPNDTLKFSFPINQPSEFYDLYFEAVISKDFNTQNLWLFIQAEAPDGSLQNDTIEYLLFDNKGRPFGKSSGDDIKFDLFYKAVVSFPLKGNYRLRVEQGMRSGQEPLLDKLTLIVRKSTLPEEAKK